MKHAQATGSSVVNHRPSVSSDTALARKLGMVATGLLPPLALAKLDGGKWLARERDFAGGYLKAFADALAQQAGRAPGSPLAASVFIQLVRQLLLDSPADSVVDFVEHAWTIDGSDMRAGSACGQADGVAFVSGKGLVLARLVRHLNKMPPSA